MWTTLTVTILARTPYASKLTGASLALRIAFPLTILDLFLV